MIEDEDEDSQYELTINRKGQAQSHASLPHMPKTVRNRTSLQRPDGMPFSVEDFLNVAD